MPKETIHTIHNDEATQNDTLNRLQYAKAFARLAETCDTPLVIGLYGGWGIGKTSLMKQIEGQLDPSKTRPVWFDPWQHQFDESPALALLHTLVDTFDLQEEGKKLLTVIAGAFGSMLLKATTTLSLRDVDELGKRYEEERFQAREARVRLHQHYQELIEKAQGNPQRRLVFFVDDLDRCMPPQTLSLLESLKLYLNLPECVYFLGVDRDALERSIRYHYKEVEVSQSSYLDKIVQLPFTIPLIAPESMDEFVSPLLSESLQPCRELLVMGLGDNPRQVKRFINTLTLNHQLASELQIPGYDPKVLAVLLLIQQLDVELYRVVARQPELLAKLQAGSEDAKSLREKHIAGNERLKEALGSVEIPQQADDLKPYIYLTQVARVREETEPGGRAIDLPVILSAHKQWLKSKGQEGSRANLSRANLLRKADLIWADLRGANLAVADLSEADLRDAYGLTEVQLDSAKTDERTILPDGSQGPFERGSGAHRAPTAKPQKRGRPTRAAD